MGIKQTALMVEALNPMLTNIDLELSEETFDLAKTYLDAVSPNDVLIVSVGPRTYTVAQTGKDTFKADGQILTKGFMLSHKTRFHPRDDKLFADFIRSLND